MEKQEYFKKELNLIRDKNVKAFAEGMLDRLPDYFFDVPASSSLKYHPSFALEEHGLVKHVRMAIKIAISLLENENFKSLRKYSDIIIVALMLHDGYKSGIVKQKYTAFTHPLIAASEIRKHHETDLKDLLTDEQCELIATAISSHMGEWSTSKYDDEVLPKPKTGLQVFVHLADYLSSRKYMGFED